MFCVRRPLTGKDKISTEFLRKFVENCVELVEVSPPLCQKCGVVKGNPFACENLA